MNMSRIQRVMKIVRREAKKYGFHQLESMRLHTNGYAEPGYSGEVIATGNWNNIDQWDNEKKCRVFLSDIPERVCNLLEKLGVEIEWSDEWSKCLDCGKLVRIHGDSYHWQPSFAKVNGELFCHECIEEDPESYLAELEGDESKCMTLDIDLTEYGYKQYNEESYESGWHPGQTDNPKVIAQELRKRGIEKFIFTLDENSQFYSKYSVYTKEEE